MNTNTVEQTKKLESLDVEVFTDICNFHDGQRFNALILDDLHRIFESIFDKYGFYCFPEVGYDAFEKIWILFEIGFKRTNNHATDWTEILIWLLENGHVTALQVNEALNI